ncbi:hypothetical protein H8356DRAFT_1403900 [Neocallimastix lanati (nom. inval.)]|nr:hypothetical protein H8356DRAFT_1403900 [Neocallimastix sp. JGI-2020a]
MRNFEDWYPTIKLEIKLSKTNLTFKNVYKHNSNNKNNNKLKAVRTYTAYETNMNSVQISDLYNLKKSDCLVCKIVKLKKFEKYCTKDSISKVYSPPYNPQNNINFANHLYNIILHVKQLLTKINPANLILNDNKLIDKLYSFTIKLFSNNTNKTIEN